MKPESHRLAFAHAEYLCSVHIQESGVPGVILNMDRECWRPLEE